MSESDSDSDSNDDAGSSTTDVVGQLARERFPELKHLFSGLLRCATDVRSTNPLESAVGDWGLANWEGIFGRRHGHAMATARLPDRTLPLLATCCYRLGLLPHWSVVVPSKSARGGALCVRRRTTTVSVSTLVEIYFALNRLGDASSPPDGTRTLAVPTLDANGKLEGFTKVDVSAHGVYEEDQQMEFRHTLATSAVAPCETYDDTASSTRHAFVLDAHCAVELEATFGRKSFDDGFSSYDSAHCGNNLRVHGLVVQKDAETGSFVFVGLDAAVLAQLQRLHARPPLPEPPDFVVRKDATPPPGTPDARTDSPSPSPRTTVSCKRARTSTDGEWPTFYKCEVCRAVFDGIGTCCEFKSLLPVDGEATDDAAGVNLCVDCHADLGACNPRQYCGKLKCVNPRMRAE